MKNMKEYKKNMLFRVNTQIFIVMTFMITPNRMYFTLQAFLMISSLF